MENGQQLRWSKWASLQKWKWGFRLWPLACKQSSHYCGWWKPLTLIHIHYGWTLHLDYDDRMFYFACRNLYLTAVLLETFPRMSFNDFCFVSVFRPPSSPSKKGTTSWQALFKYAKQSTIECAINLILFCESFICDAVKAAVPEKIMSACNLKYSY